MTQDQLTAEPLQHEYEGIVAHSRLPNGSISLESLRTELVTSGEWTPNAAEHLVSLARRYGTFMLRNALALAGALGLEDGELGF